MMCSLHVKSEFVSIVIHSVKQLLVKVEEKQQCTFHLKSKLTWTVMGNSCFQPVYKISSGNLRMLHRNNAGLAVQLESA